MKSIINFKSLTFPQPQSAKKLRKTASLALRQRHPYGRPRRNNTVKELDSETGLYYFGARYLDPKTGRWISGDPAVGEYIPVAPVNEEARKRNGSLPGMGVVFNYVNLHVYHYAGNNPVKLVDPDGKAAGDEFDTIDDAAKDFAATYNDDSIRYNREYGSSIYMTDNGKYSYTVPRRSMSSWSVTPSVHPTKRTLAIVHSHGREERGAGNKDRISEQDMENAERYGIPSYVVLPSGGLEKYDPNEIRLNSWDDGIRSVGYGFPNMNNSENGIDNPVIDYFSYIRNHREHNKNFPGQKTPWFSYLF